MSDWLFTAPWSATTQSHPPSETVRRELPLLVRAIEPPAHYNRRFPVNACNAAPNTLLRAAPELVTRVGVQRQQRVTGGHKEHPSGQDRGGGLHPQIPCLLQARYPLW